MRKEEAEVWNNYRKFKSLNKKIVEIQKLKTLGDTVSLDNLCDEYFKNTSRTIRDEIIKVVEYLELKLSTRLTNLPNYEKLLKKHKSNSLINYEFNSFKTILRSELTNQVNIFVESVNKMKDVKNAKLELKFPITSNIYGTVELSISVKNSGSILHNLHFGFISNYRDIGAGYINNFPQDQIHYQNSFLVKSNFDLFDNKFIEMNNYFNFIQNLENSLLNVDEDLSINSKYYNEFHSNLFFNNHLCFILSLINIQQKNNTFDKLKKTIEEGLKIQDPKRAGYGWIDYYKEKLATLIN